MLRYRVLNIDFDFRPNVMSLSIAPDWEPQVQELLRQNREQAEREFLACFGVQAGERKIADCIDLGQAPVSIVAYHNHYLRDVRDAFVLGSYYSSLAGACSLGERILNHVILSLRDEYRATPEYKNVYRNESFDNWDRVIDTLHAWGVFRDTVAVAYRELRDERNRALHFNQELDQNVRPAALRAIRLLGQIIEAQFGTGADVPWIICATGLIPFVRKSSEQAPFVRRFYLPNAALVAPDHKLRVDAATRRFAVDSVGHDDGSDGSDEEFVRRFEAARAQVAPGA